MHNYIQHTHYPLFPTDNYSSKKSFGYNFTTHKLHLTSFFQKRLDSIYRKSLDIREKRHQILPIRGNDDVSALYYQNRIRLRYMDYFRVKLVGYETMLKKHQNLDQGGPTNSRDQLSQKQLTFLVIRAEEIKYDLTMNHMQLKNAVIGHSSLLLEEVKREERNISFKILNFLADLYNAKKNLLALVIKPVSAEYQL